MRYFIGVLALAFSVSALSATLFKESGYVETLRYADSTIGQNASQLENYVILVERPRFAECGARLEITPEGLPQIGGLLSAAWVKGTAVRLGILDFDTATQGGCKVVNVNVTD